MLRLSNPVVEHVQAREAERRVKEAFRFPFKLICVLGEIEERTHYTSIKLVQKFCQENNIAFAIREYNSDRFEIDRQYVSRFPAFHLLERASNDWWLTMYGDENPISTLQDEIMRYREKEQEKRERAAIQETRLNSIKRIFHFEGGWFKRRSVLPAEAQAAMKEKKEEKKKKMGAAQVPLELSPAAEESASAFPNIK